MTRVRVKQGEGMFGVQLATHSSQPNPAPIISSLSAGVPNATDATITWTTDLASNSRVFWGTTITYAGGSSPILDATLVTSHSVQITGLTTATLYHYMVQSVNTAGRSVTSADGTFTTA